MGKNTLVISEYQAALIGALWGESHHLDKHVAELAAQTWYLNTAQHARYRSGLETYLGHALCPRWESGSDSPSG